MLAHCTYTTGVACDCGSEEGREGTGQQAAETGDQAVTAKSADTTASGIERDVGLYQGSEAEESDWKPLHRVEKRRVGMSKVVYVWRSAV